MTIRMRPGRSRDHGRSLEVWRAAVETSHTFLDTSDIDSYEAIVAEYIPQMADLRVAVDEKDEVLVSWPRMPGRSTCSSLTPPPSAEAS